MLTSFTDMIVTREQEVMQMFKSLLGRFSDQLARHRILLFVLRAQGCAGPHSDFDLAVTGDEPLSLKDFYTLTYELDALPTLYRFDWVCNPPQVSTIQK